MMRAIGKATVKAHELAAAVPRLPVAMAHLEERPMALQVYPMEVVQGRMEAVECRMETMAAMAIPVTAILLRPSVAIAHLREVLHRRMAVIMRHYSTYRPTLLYRGITNVPDR